MVFLRRLVGSVSSRTAPLGGPLVTLVGTRRRGLPRAPFGEHAAPYFAKRARFRSTLVGDVERKVPVRRILVPGLVTACGTLLGW
jgi:hypothetical protein